MSDKTEAGALGTTFGTELKLCVWNCVEIHSWPPFWPSGLPVNPQYCGPDLSVSEGGQDYNDHQLQDQDRSSITFTLFPGEW